MINIWNRKTDSGAVHVLGNGRMMVFGRGPEILQVLGNPISADSFCRIDLPDVSECRRARVLGTAIWTFTLPDGMKITDCVDPDSNAFVRKIEGQNELRLVLSVEQAFSPAGRNPGDGIFRFSAENGVRFLFYHVDCAPMRVFSVSGSISVSTAGENTYELHFKGGVGHLFIADETQSIFRAKTMSEEEREDAVRQYWHRFLSKMRPFPEELRALAEEVAVMIKSQQADDGAVIAGYAYHLGYVRDQYGVARGLLSMGFDREAMEIMRFFREYHEKYGVVHNAQSVTHHGVFHVHENDRVEITGYLTELAFRIYETTGDREFLRETLPLIKWCIESQKQALKNGMIPFNGDETYIAGGVLPRSAMYDGSAEATLLFAENLRAYKTHTGDHSYDETLEEVHRTYLSNFVDGTRYYANNPARMRPEEYPDKRYGVCECCRGVFGIFDKTENDRYVCNRCRTFDLLPKRSFGKVELTSAKLMPMYLGSDMLPDDLSARIINDTARTFCETGLLPSGCDDGYAVGYDFGLFLYALSKAKHPTAKAAFERIMSLRDETGVWSEYYLNGSHAGSRCRAWESAVSMEAIVTYFETLPLLHPNERITP